MRRDDRKKNMKKRFYTTVAVAPYEKEFAVTLDGKPIKTPIGTVLRGSEALAKAMAAEWESQAETINPDKMPITRIVSIARDRVPQDRALLIDDIVNYAGSDLLCYRAPYSSSPLEGERDVHLHIRGGKEQKPQPPTETLARFDSPSGGELRDEQESLFTPILDWAAGQGMALQATESVMPITQPEASLAKVREVVSAASDLELAALAMATPLLGSAILALWLWRGHDKGGTINYCVPRVDIVLKAARVDEDFQAAKWGQDPEAKAQWMKREVDICGAAVVLAEKLNGD